MGIMLVLALAGQAVGANPMPAAGREVFRDLGFERGFMLTAAGHLKPLKPPYEIGVLRTNNRTPAGPPAWRLAQWGTHYLLKPGAGAVLADGTWVAENPAKRVVIERGGAGGPRLRLEVRGGVEYDHHLRAFGQPWPHLLIEQGFDKPIQLGDVKRLPFSLGMRVVKCKLDPKAGKPDPSLHTAQVTAFWTVHSSAPGHVDMIWFGIPLFDARYDVPPPLYALDRGKPDASGKFICTLAGKRFWKGRTGDGRWRRLDVDLLPLIREALAIAQRHGHLKDARLQDLSIGSFNLGWEVPGPYDAEIELRGLSMKVEK